jgi:hypothetical protein
MSMTRHSRCDKQPVVLAMTVLILALLATAVYAEATTPWEFFRANMDRSGSVTAKLGVIFFTLVLAWLSLGALRLLLPIVLIALVVLGVRKPEVRSSRVVQTGGSLLVLGVMPLLLAVILGADNPIGLGLLFAFLTPLGLFVAGAGTVIALAKNRLGRSN